VNRAHQTARRHTGRRQQAGTTFTRKDKKWSLVLSTEALETRKTTGDATISQDLVAPSSEEAPCSQNGGAGNVNAKKRLCCGCTLKPVAS
jgi:hypothetical protein